MVGALDCINDFTLDKKNNIGSRVRNINRMSGIRALNFYDWELYYSINSVSKIFLKIAHLFQCLSLHSLIVCD